MRKRIIVIDDSRPLRQLIWTELTAAGYEVIEAVGGRDGLLQLRWVESIAVAICDINMPQMGGFDLLTSLAKEPLRRPVPIVMLTSEIDTTMLERARAGGASGWLMKPLKPGVVAAAVRKLAGAPEVPAAVDVRLTRAPAPVRPGRS